MGDIWIVLIEDRHGDTDALPFSNEDEAVSWATRRAGHDGVPREELTAAMREDGWVHVFPYGTEGDRLRVIQRAVDGR